MQEILSTDFLSRLINEGGAEVVMVEELPRLGAQ